MSEVDFEDTEDFSSEQDLPAGPSPETDSGYRAFVKEFLQKPGEHLFGLGTTGSGKTHKAYWFLKQLLPYETVIWFDTGKSSNLGREPEIGPLFSMGLPINIIIPQGCKFEVINSPVPVTVNESEIPDLIWDYIKPGCLNIGIISRYFLDPGTYANYISKAYKRLIAIAQSGRFPRSKLPLAIFQDEFQDVCPGQTLALTKTHLESAKHISWNINKLRSCGIRILGFTQKYTFVYPNARIAFTWVLACRGAYFEREDPDLGAFNKMYKRLDKEQAVLWFPKKIFNHRWRFSKFYTPEGLEIISSGVVEEDKPSKGGKHGQF